MNPNDFFEFIFPVVVILSLAIFAYLIQSRAQARQATKNLMEMTEFVLDAIPVPVYLRDNDGRLLITNKAHCNLIGRKREEAIGKTVFELYLPHEAEKFAALDRKVLEEEGKGEIAENQAFSDPTGKVHELVTSKGVYRTKEGRIAGTIGVSIDITEQKALEEKLRQQAELIDIAPDAIMVCDLESKILFWNKGAEQIYGWTAQEALGQSTLDLIYPKGDSVQYNEMLHAVLGKGIWKGEVCHVTKDNKDLVIGTHRTLMRDAEGAAKSLLIINTDITEKKKIQTQLMRAQRLDGLGVLAGGIAHDLNNILAPIAMSIGLLKRSAKDAQTMDIIDTIETSAKRGAAVVKQVLSFAHGIEGDRTAIQLKHLLKEIEHIIKQTFPKNIDLDISFPQDLWTIMGDPTQLHQVLLNLCINSRDAMPNGGLLKITTENRRLHEQDVGIISQQAKPGPYVILSVTDTGTGITPDILDKIFVPFFTTKESGKGTGLGLSTTMGIVKSHGGFLTVYSEPNQGTTFRIYLPAEPSLEAAQRKTKTVKLFSGKGETILLVDDESSILAITSQALLTFGYKVRTATNGAQAVAVYTEHRKEIAAVITDMSMPIMDGPSAIRALREIDPAVRIIAASGLHDDSSMTRAAVAGVRYFLNKPCATETLLKTLREILDAPLTADQVPDIRPTLGRLQ